MGFLDPLINTDQPDDLPLSSPTSVIFLSMSYLILMGVLTLLMKNKVSFCE
jgi:hypothetical protein